MTKYCTRHAIIIRSLGKKREEKGRVLGGPGECRGTRRAQLSGCRRVTLVTMDADA